jgi:hypothetical protein
MALTKPFETYERPGLVVAYKMSNVKIYKGSLVAVNAAGFAVPVSHASANLKPVGVANETADNSGGAAGAKTLNVTKAGAFVFKAASGFTPAQADLGKEVYALTDWEVQVATGGLTNQYKVGTIVALESASTGQSGVRVRIDNHCV